MDLPRAVDGDTLDAMIILPLGVHLRRRIRLKGFYAPELDGSSPEAGHRAKALLQGFCEKGGLYLRCTGMKEDNHGRLVGELYVNNLPVDPSEVLCELQLTPEAHRADVAFARRAKGAAKRAL